MTIPTNINDNYLTMNYDELFDEDIGDFISECLSPTSDSDDTPVNSYKEQPNTVADGIEPFPPQLVTSSVPIQSLTSRLSDVAIVSPTSNWPMYDSSRNGSSSCEDSSSGGKKVERR